MINRKIYYKLQELYSEGINIEETFASFEPRIVDIESGLFTDKFNPKTFNDLKAASDPLLSVALKMIQHPLAEDQIM